MLTKLNYTLALLMLGSVAKIHLLQVLMTNEDWTLIFTRPVSLMLLVLAGVSVILATHYRIERQQQATGLE